jgi:hypothetical protein
MPHRQNFLLNRLEPAVLAQILPHLSLVDLQHGHVLAETHQRVERVYFPRAFGRRRNRDWHDRQ